LSERLIDLGLTKSDRSFWTSIPFVILVVVAFMAIMFLPLIETDICTTSGECSDTKILKSLYEILIGQ
jgi:hypothetical protein